MSRRNHRIKISLSEKEKAKLEHDADLCGLSQSEFLRQVCLGKVPHAKPPAEFWGLMEALYDLHSQWERLSVFCPEAYEECHRLENLVLFLQKEVA